MSSEAEQQSNTLHFLDYWRVIRSRKEIVLAVAILVVITGTVYTLLLPNIYESEVRISVSEDNPQINPFAADQGSYMAYNPYFLRTQFEIIQSTPIFETVVNRLNLLDKWGQDGEKVAREIALKILENSIAVIQERDTTLIRIVVRRDDFNEAAQIANELAEVYKDSRLEIANREMRGALDQMDQALKDQSERVLAAEQEVQAIREKYSIATPGEGQIDIEDFQMQELLGARLAAQRTMVDAGESLKILEDLEDKDLVNVATAITTDQLVMNIVMRLQDIEVQLSSLSADFGPNHPEVKRFKNQHIQAEQALKDQLTALRSRLQTEFDLAKNRFDQLDSLLESVKATTITEQGEKYLPFRKAMADLENERFIYNQLNSRLRQEIITMSVPRHPVEIIDTAEPNRRPVSPNLFLNVLLSIFVGLAAGVGLAYFIEYLDTSIKTAEDIERILGLPVLGLIPQKVRPLIEEGPDSEHAEVYRVLRTNLAFTEGGAHHGAFSVLSSGAGEGKSTTVFNLAYVCAQQGEKVLLVDADLRRPVQHTILGVSNRFGLTNVLLRDVPVEEAIKATSVPNLHFLPSGRLPRTSLGILDPKRIGELISSLKNKYDVVLIDTPPLVGISDSAIIAKETDGAIIVVQYRKYPREMLAKARQMVESLGVTVIGAVLNNINVMRDDYYYYYHSYYSDYYHSSQSDVSDENEL